MEKRLFTLLLLLLLSDIVLLLLLLRYTIPVISSFCLSIQIYDSCPECCQFTKLNPPTLCACKTQEREDGGICLECNLPFCNCQCECDCYNETNKKSHEWWDYNKCSDLFSQQQTAEKTAALKQQLEQVVPSEMQQTGTLEQFAILSTTKPSALTALVQAKQHQDFPTQVPSYASAATEPLNKRAHPVSGSRTPKFVSTTLMSFCGEGAETLALLIFDVLQVYEQGTRFHKKPEANQKALHLLITQFCESIGSA
ncbi:hypothetical protein Pelo_17994 [Pelomyxa schiedti]|nr:hypothetical protein Pelo_17994 [Pelomyxa schiedti]